MTATAVESPTEALDLDDLKLLDDDVRHGACTVCHPRPIGLGVPFVAFCGRRAIWLVRLEADPRRLCPHCEATPACVTCGALR